MNRIITFFLLTLGKISSFLSMGARTRLGCLTGGALRLLSSSRKRVTLENIEKAFPEKSPDWHYDIMTQSYNNLGITLIELLAFPSMKESDFRKYVEYSNIELIEEIYSRGKGVVLLSGHFGNWEMLAYTAGLFTRLPVLIVVKPQKNDSADSILNKYRTQGGNRIISMFSAARGLIKALRDREMVALLADQSASPDTDIFVDFFGRKALTYKAPAELALRFGTPIVMGVSVRNSDGAYTVELKEIKYDDLNNDKEGIYELTRRHVKELENEIRKNPGLWSWQHKRWKHLPSN